jgi:hypothetical protein
MDATRAQALTVALATDSLPDSASAGTAMPQPGTNQLPQIVGK